MVLIAPMGDDPSSAIVRALLQPHVTVVPLPLDGPLPDKARFRAGGQTLLRADGPAGRPGPASPEAAEAIASAGTLLVSDYGRGAPPTPRSGPPWPGARPVSRWSGIRIPAGRSRCPAPGWLPPTTPKPGRPPAWTPRPPGRLLADHPVTGAVLRSAAEAAGSCSAGGRWTAWP